VKLVVRKRDGSYSIHELTDRPLTLGRDESCDIILRDDGEVSRHHARLWRDETGQILVADTDSKNGTRVDASDFFKGATHPVERTVRIGGYEIELIDAAVRDTEATQVRFAPDGPTEADHASFYPSSRSLDLNQQRLALLMSLTERIGGAFERKQLLEQAIDACRETLNFERGLIALKTVRGETETPVTRNIERDETGAYKVSRTLINRALVHGERAVVNNPAVDLVDNITDSLVRFPICSALCVPIMHREEILGVIYGDRVTQAATYTEQDVDFLAAIARQVGVGLANLRLFRTHLEAEKFRAQLEQARLIQCNLLPAGPLQTGCVALAGHNEASETVGGDYFDYFPLDDRRIGVIVADVTGHGLPAALVMANLQAAVRVALTADIPLTNLATRLNRHVYTNTSSGVFITAIVGRIDTTTGLIEYFNAGHPAPVVFQRGDLQLADDGLALPLGIDISEQYPPQQIELGTASDGILFYTDGLIEAEDASGKLLQIEPVLDALTRARVRSADSILKATLSTVRQHIGKAAHTDDLTLVAATPADLSAHPQA
jgi:sigma-B regulation protein RsbU (phosphoserine phosphatase)